MIQTVIASTVLVAALLTASDVGARPIDSAAAQAATQATAADAAPFIGEWTLDLQGPDGPGVFDLTVKVEKEKVTGEITGGTTPTQPITEITKSDKSLVLSYSFNYEGTPVEAVVRLTPAPEARMNAQINFAGGAYIMSGPATRKEKAK